MKKIVLLLAVALVLPGVAAAQDYVYTGREGKMMLVGDMASKRLEQKKAQKKARNESKKEQPKKAATQKNQGLPYYCYGREGKAMILGELTAKWLEQKKAQAKAQKEEQKKAQAKAQKEEQKKASVKPAAAQSQGLPHYYYGREGKMMLLGDMMWKALKRQSDEVAAKAAAEAAAQQEKQTESKK